MKFILFSFFSLCFFVSAAQTTPFEHKRHDFSKVDINKVDVEKLNRHVDSLYMKFYGDSLLQLQDYIRAKTPKKFYVAFVIGYESSMASLTDLNSELQAISMKEVSENFSGVPFGFAMKGKRWLTTCSVIPFTKQTITSSDVDLAVSAMNIDLNFGYDILNARKIQLYPQFSLGWQQF